MTDPVAPSWSRGWRLSPKRFDSLRSLRCLLLGHPWQVNQRRTQRSCPRCWMVQDTRVIPPAVTEDPS